MIHGHREKETSKVKTQDSANKISEQRKQVKQSIHHKEHRRCKDVLSGIEVVLNP